MAIPEEIQKQVLAEATSATPNFSVDMNDPRLQQVKQEGAADVAELEGTYNGIINKTDKFYEDLSGAYQQQADKLAQIQQENTDFAIEKIEQQKEQAHKDYIKEQSGAYVDWQKQSDPYGVNAEKMASAGLTTTGYAESSQVAMYNAYQNRVAMAKDSLDRAMLNYDNGIKEAMLQNNAAIAEIYANLFVKQAEIALEGFQYGNTLVLELADKKQTLKDNNWQKQMQIIQQMQSEQDRKADIWKYQDNQAWQTEQADLNRQHDKDMADINHNYQLERDELNRQFQADQAELDRNFEREMFNAKTKAEKEAAERKYKHDKEMLAQQHKNNLATLDKQLANDKALASYTNSLNKSSSSSSTKITGSSSSKGSSSSSNKGSSSSSTKVSGSSSSTTKPKLTPSQIKSGASTASAATPNMASILQLGLGPISATYLAQLVASGAVIATEKNGQIYYRKAAGKNLR